MRKSNTMTKNIHFFLFYLIYIVMTIPKNVHLLPYFIIFRIVFRSIFISLLHNSLYSHIFVSLKINSHIIMIGLSQTDTGKAPRSAILFEYVRNVKDATLEVATEHYAVGYIFHGSCRVITDDMSHDVSEHCPYILERGHHIIESTTDENSVFEQIVMHLDPSSMPATSSITTEDERLESVVLGAVTENVSLEELAERCCVSVSTFKRRFRRRFSISPHRWFLQRKLELAYRIILGTDQSIAEVSRLCGFINASHFISSFKRYYRVTPATLRRRSKVREEDND